MTTSVKAKTRNFTLSNYTSLLDSLLENYKFINYSEIQSQASPSVIWRHDVDASVHNALELAVIEHERGIQSTYFFMLSNWFYDIRDKEINAIIRKISDLGHYLALHFDFEYLPSGNISCLNSFTRALLDQKFELEKILNTSIDVVSFHNPTVVDSSLFTNINNHCILEGMTNSYSKKINSKFKYCSDSNGYWRYESLEQLIDPKLYPYLHILTHPEWWDNSMLTPRKKIEKILVSRAKDMLSRYDNLLAENNRQNY